MVEVAEVLRWTVIALQAGLIGWMLRSGLWRRVPMWTLWLAVEVVLRAPFETSGWYAHHFWLPIQPAWMFLLGASAVEADFQARRKPAVVLVYSLAVVPVGIVLPLPELIVLRVWVLAAIAVWLAFARGSFTATVHARLLALVAGAGAAAGWMPAAGTAWWTLRAGFLGIYVLMLGGWIALFSLPDRPARFPGPPLA